MVFQALCLSLNSFSDMWINSQLKISPPLNLPAEVRPACGIFPRVSASFRSLLPRLVQKCSVPPALLKVFDAPFLFGPKIFGGSHSFLRPHLGFTLRPVPNLGSYRILLFLWKPPKNSYLDICTEIFHVQTVWILLPLHKMFTRNYFFVCHSH